MGGASRNEKKRRQEAAAQRLNAAGIQVPLKKAANRTPLIVVGVVVAVAVIVGLGVFLTRGTGGVPVVPSYSATLSGAVVTAGAGPVVIDVYEDFLCPQCERFEKRYGDELTTALNTGKVTVRYHGIAILADRTTPPGYSTRAANAALCAVPAGIFPAYHKALFGSQPAESSAGLTDDRLIELGAGARGDFAGCVRGAGYAAAITAETEASVNTAAAQTNGQFGTPTVTIKNTKIDLNNTSWLADAIAVG